LHQIRSWSTIVTMPIGASRHLAASAAMRSKLPSAGVSRMS
jgi:hypothetical protein